MQNKKNEEIKDEDNMNINGPITTKKRKLMLSILWRKEKELKAKFPSSLERIFYNKYVT